MEHVSHGIHETLNQSKTMNESPTQKSPAWLIALAWLLVALPLSWGLYQSILKSKPLFMGPAVAAAPSSAQPAPK
jgi:hypothetical protein